MNTNRIRTIAGLLLLLGAIILFSGCGQKGPLYLPDKTENQQQN